MDTSSPRLVRRRVRNYVLTSVVVTAVIVVVAIELRRTSEHNVAAPPEQWKTSEFWQAPQNEGEMHTACQFVVGNDGANACPVGASSVTDQECREMPYHFGGLLHQPFSEDRAQDPKGCFFLNAQYYYNTNAVGMANPNRRVYCKVCKSIPRMELGDWSEWGSGASSSLVLARKVSDRFRKIAVGSCADIGWYPIKSKPACEEAASYLGLMDKGADFTDVAGRPGGCYYLRNYQDTTETLWMNTNPYSTGNGAETSDLGKGELRQPLCSKEDTTGTSAAGAVQPTQQPQSPAKFRQIKQGVCEDIGFFPIHDAGKCNAAAKYLGLVDTVATNLDLPTRPEGCYFFWNSHDLTSTLWLNTSPESTGNGATFTQGTHPGKRTPLCMASADEPSTTESYYNSVTVAPYVAPTLAPMAPAPYSPPQPTGVASAVPPAWAPPNVYTPPTTANPLPWR